MKLISHTMANHLDGRVLQDWYDIRINTYALPEAQQYHAPGTAILVTTSKEVIFCSQIHENKENPCPHSYSGQFTDEEILKDRDLISWVLKRYGSVWATR